MNGSDLLAHLEAAAAEGLAPNLARFLAFLGWQEGEWFELQALGVPDGKARVNRAAHGSDLATLTRLAESADAARGVGVYAIFNQIKPAVVARHERNAWYTMGREDKGDDKNSTKDHDIARRRLLYFDFDPEREDGVKGISATDDEMRLTFDRAARCHDLLVRFISPKSIGAGRSGNGSALFLRLAAMAPDKENERIIRSILEAVAMLLDDAFVTVDLKVYDPKRLCFLPGTVKRKGAHSPERPHRRASFVGPEDPYCLTQEDLVGLLASLRAELTEEQREKLDRLTTGAKGAAAPTRASGERPAASTSGERAGDIANRQIPMADVLARFGLMRGDRPVCPGCGEGGGTDVEILSNNLLNCKHNRCAHAGIPSSPGNRNVTGLVMEKMGVDFFGALDWCRREFPHVGIPDRQPPPAKPALRLVSSHPEVPDAQEPAPPVPFLPLETPRNLPVFPLATLPTEVATFAEQLAASFETPVDLPAVLALGALASACMRRFDVAPWGDWREPLNLYLVAALDPGEAKSPVYRRVFGPLRELEDRMVEAFEEEQKRTEQAAEGSDRKKGAPAAPTPKPRLFIDDATPERIAGILAEQGERITLASDEGTAFAQMCGLYSKNGQANVGVYLQSHDGGRITVDRQKGGTVQLRNPLMTMALAVQPAVIRELAKRPDLMGRGLWARFAYVFPASKIGTHTYDAPPVDPMVQGRWRALLMELASAPVPKTPGVLTFTSEATERLRAAAVEISRAQLPGGKLSSLGGWASKLRGLLARLTGLLHVLGLALVEDDRPDLTPVAVETVERALELGRYFTAHALYTFDVEMTLDPAEQAARTAWEVIQRKGLDRVTPGRLGSWVKVLRKTADATAALDVLCERGCLRRDGAHRGQGRAYVVVQREERESLPTPSDPVRPPSDLPVQAETQGKTSRPTVASDLSDLSSLDPSPDASPPPDRSDGSDGSDEPRNPQKSSARRSDERSDERSDASSSPPPASTVTPSPPGPPPARVPPPAASVEPFGMREVMALDIEDPDEAVAE